MEDPWRGQATARAVGALGSAAVAIGGLGAGALPVSEVWAGPGAFGREHPDAGLVCVYTGLALLLLAWWWYGRLLRAVARRRGTEAALRPALTTLLLWAAPMLLAPPLFSRDVYSYLAQGVMTSAGLDVYAHGPAVLGGPLAAEVPAVWQHTPSPYGPLFLLAAVVVGAVAQADVVLGVLALRLVAVLGLLLLAAALPALARGCGRDPAAAVWLGALNPLVLVHLVGGAHNDALMVGLLAVGLAAAVRRRPVLATLLVVAAAMVKVPAVLGLVAVAALWATHLPGRGRGVRAAAATGAVAAAATAVITAVAGTGYGWIGALRTPISPHNWSLTSALGRWTALVTDAVRPEDAVAAWRWAGALATVVVAALVWAYRERLGPVHALGLVLLAVVVFGPALRPWYLVWGLVPLAAAAADPRLRRGLAALCAVLVLAVLPSGFAPEGGQILLAVLGVAVGVAVFAVIRWAAAPRPAWAPS